MSVSFATSGPPPVEVVVEVTHGSSSSSSLDKKSGIGSNKDSNKKKHDRLDEHDFSATTTTTTAATTATSTMSPSNRSTTANALVERLMFMESAPIAPMVAPPSSTTEVYLMGIDVTTSATAEAEMSHHSGGDVSAGGSFHSQGTGGTGARSYIGVNLGSAADSDEDSTTAEFTNDNKLNDRGVPNWLMTEILTCHKHIRARQEGKDAKKSKSVGNSADSYIDPTGRALTAQLTRLDMSTYKNFTVQTNMKAQRKKIESERRAERKSTAYSTTTDAGRASGRTGGGGEYGSSDGVVVTFADENRIINGNRDGVDDDNFNSTLTAMKTVEVAASISDATGKQLVHVNSSATFATTLSNKPAKEETEEEKRLREDPFLENKRWVWRHLTMFNVQAKFLIPFYNQIVRRRAEMHSKAGKLQKEFKKFRRKKNVKSLVVRIKECLRFHVNMLIFRRRLACKILRQFLSPPKDSYRAVIKRFVQKIRVIQLRTRSYFAIKRARFEMLNRYWEKLENKCRVNVVKQEKKKMQDMIDAERKKMKNSKKIVTSMTTAEKWSLLNEKIEEFNPRVMEARNEYRLHMKKFNPDISMASTGDEWNVLSDRIDPSVRSMIIHDTLLSKMKCHIQKVELRRKEMDISMRGMIGESTIAEYLLAPSETEEEAKILKGIEEEQMFVFNANEALRYRNKHTKGLKQKMKTPQAINILVPFFLLHGHYGRSWLGTVNRIVKKDIAVKREAYFARIRAASRPATEVGFGGDASVVGLGETAMDDAPHSFSSFTNVSGNATAHMTPRPPGSGVSSRPPRLGLGVESVTSGASMDTSRSLDGGGGNGFGVNTVLKGQNEGGGGRKLPNNYTNTNTNAKAGSQSARGPNPNPPLNPKPSSSSRKKAAK